MAVLTRRGKTPRRPIRASWIVTAYCNLPHVARTGRPVGHLCHVLAPAVLRAERAGTLGDLYAVVQAHHDARRPIVQGRGRR